MQTLPVRNDRRTRPRHRFHVPLEIDVGDRRARIGVSQDASPEGMLFNTQSRLSPGDTIILTLSLPGLQSAQARARVVRVTGVDMESPLPWRYLAAVQFEAALPALEESLRAAAPPTSSP